MTFYISEFFKKFVTRNNGSSTRPLKIFNHTVDTIEVSIVDKNNQLLDIPAGQYYFVGSYRKKGNTPVFLATDYNIEDKVLRFNYSTYTYEFLNLIRGENVEIAVEIGYKDEEGEHVILQDWALASERYYVDGMPEPARVAEYYTKLQTDARIDEKIEAAIEGLELSGYVTDEEFEEGMATKQNAITSENKLDYDLISGAPLIPSKTSELVNDSGFVTITAVDGEIENAISGKADKSEIPTEVSELTNDTGYITEQAVTESIAAHNESAEAHSTLFGEKQDKITEDSKLDFGLISGAPAIPTSTSQLVNDSGFVTEAVLDGYATEDYVDGAISGKADKSEIPTAVSELENDAEYASSGYVTNSISAHNESTDAHSALFAAKQDEITEENKLDFSLISGAPEMGVAWGGITGTLSSQTDLQDALNLKADKEQLDALDEVLQEIIRNRLEKTPFYVEAAEANDIVKITANGGPDPVNLKYSTDNKTWNDYTIGDQITLANVGDKVYFKGNNETFSPARYNTYYFIIISKKSNVGGNIVSLADETMQKTTLPSFSHLFTGNGNKLIDASKLVLKYTGDNCYAYMFRGCTGLTSAPALPATTLAQGCYYQMFQGCTGLTSAPALPATTLSKSCYTQMFQGCTGLTSAPALPATTLSQSCYTQMFQGCTGLTSAPALPATTLSQSCYTQMFQGCTGLTSAPELPATSLSYACYNQMFQGCTGLSSVKVMFTSSWYGMDNWLGNVSPTGTFYCPAALGTNETIERGTSRCPEGWTVVNI